MSKLYNKIIEKKAIIGVMGLGYVGLPLAVEKARAGYKVIGFDIQQKRVDMINNGQNYIGDVQDEELEELVKKNKLTATTNFDKLSKCDVVSICVPTPLDKFKQPDLSYIIQTSKDIAKRLHKEQLIILESTTYPGTTEEIVLPILLETGLKVGEDFYLAFSPERVDPGNIRYKTRNTPKVVGGITKECTKHAKALYENVLDAPVFPVSSPKAAEMAKILENTFRLVNIALVQEMTKVAEKMNVNIWEVIDAAATKPFGYMPFYPGPGIGGHCIPIDPFYLSYKAREYDLHLMLVEQAGQVADEMPYYVVQRLGDILNKYKKPFNGSKILVLGVAYKGNIDDMRESPALKVIEILEEKKANISYFDPFIPSFELNGKKYHSIKLEKERLKEFDGAIITTAHTVGIDYNLIVENVPFVFDTKNILKNLKKNNVFVL
ncbi:UDP-N-acetyl-D-glucosamine dehydrogenase [Thermosipho melanesiensis]|uniref:UDP-glucose 6-dehydrogenase n=2 Tax=Thermosipho melanesiensis TaxID=46541 RepID=A6LMN7_THEM4|nr:nucleotide sugar dehydrogenase [Thermosipho melanesiensis]ABR31188.1 UDP-glucose 6-dehydrogenase [Thermosipho melanesiensis BI429]APT74277.1 UDP-N-acetyl-D-glucosamine dehydrogenase [Thermosipho melanesiensis]OOC36216.1 UDP-N-acetyl-D-glucosamine dehydrogenase [Thermosipho melanesiensis]OOC37034.1 UDP-N-acetyl-D-glucosamine dehydrogenase [Thermosipho melanesiensis]OOC37786.1 UDP-N-acetyl-D-glucosamine dehydrogenase [Thermosipho melanesiensis]